jgi:hypothetical protein
MKVMMIGALGLLTMASATGKLVFESESLKETAAPAEEQHEVKFRFTNAGGQPVRVTHIESTCGCLSAKPDRESYQSGEKGMITAVFKLGSFEGAVTKTLYVLSDDPDDRKRQLSVTIEIPRLFEISPEVTTWTLGDEPTPKTISFKVRQEKPVEVTAVTTTRQNFTTELKEIAKGRHYEIILTPISTAEPILGAVRIETNCEVPRYRLRLVFFNVLRPLAAKPAAPVTPATASATSPIRVPAVPTPTPAPGTTPPVLVPPTPAAVPTK